MARKRMIDPGIWEDEALNTLPVQARLLFICCISEADDEGRLRAHPGRLRGRAFSYDDDVSVGAVDGWLGLLDRRGLVVRYKRGGQVFAYLPSFLKHQWLSHPTPSKLPPPPGRTTDGALSEDRERTPRVLTESSPSKERNRRKESRSNRRRPRNPPGSKVAGASRTAPRKDRYVRGRYAHIVKS